jgi:hypothetical protein
LRVVLSFPAQPCISKLEKRHKFFERPRLKCDRLVFR